ncbi:MAG: FecR family protein [Melioribacteraceae bacterium]
MKKLFTIFIFSVIIIPLCVLKAESPKDPIAIAKKVIKEVTFKDGLEKESWIDLKASQTLSAESEVKTGTKSLAAILFTDGSGTITVRENSHLFIYGDKGDKKINNKNSFLDKGVIGFKVTKQKDDAFLISTPTAVASIRGSSGFVEFDDDSTFIFHLNDGSASVKLLIGDKAEQEIGEGYTIEVHPDGQIVYRAATSEEQTTFNDTMNLNNSKKLFINTPDGKVEIEYTE